MAPKARRADIFYTTQLGLDLIIETHDLDSKPIRSSKPFYRLWWLFNIRKRLLATQNSLNSGRPICFFTRHDKLTFFAQHLLDQSFELFEILSLVRTRKHLDFEVDLERFVLHFC
jgi:hypothetical protein